MHAPPKKPEPVTPRILLRAYAVGLFPMGEDEGDDHLHWFDPHERGIIPLDGLIVSKSLAKTMRAAQFRSRRTGISRASSPAAPRVGRGAKKPGSTGASPTVPRTFRPRLRPFDRGLARWRTGGRALRAGDGRRLFRRKHVPSRHRRVKSLPGPSGGAAELRRLSPARRAIRHAASGKPRRDRNSPRRIPGAAPAALLIEGDFQALDRTDLSPATILSVGRDQKT